MITDELLIQNIKYYLLYGLNDNITYLKEFNDFDKLLKYLVKRVEPYYDDYKIIRGKEIRYKKPILKHFL